MANYFKQLPRIIVVCDNSQFLIMQSRHQPVYFNNFNVVSGHNFNVVSGYNFNVVSGYNFNVMSGYNFNVVSGQYIFPFN